jgi:hypothetical protein
MDLDIRLIDIGRLFETLAHKLSTFRLERRRETLDFVLSPLFGALQRSAFVLGLPEFLLQEFKLRLCQSRGFKSL